MSEVFFVSDHHFGHLNIIEFEKEARPFADVDHMNHELIKRHNMVVKPDDKVYFVGDIVWEKECLYLLHELNGKKRLIMGNHDKFDVLEYRKYFERVQGVMYWDRCVVTHVPVHPKSLGSRFFLNIHGHLHSSRVMLDPHRPDPNYFNVSVEQNDLMPTHESLIRERMRQIEEQK